jgi:hypothetical protein
MAALELVFVGRRMLPEKQIVIIRISVEPIRRFETGAISSLRRDRQCGDGKNRNQIETKAREHNLFFRGRGQLPQPV